MEEFPEITLDPKQKYSKKGDLQLKKVVTLLTVLFLFFSLIACDAETGIDVKRNDKQTEQTTEDIQQNEKNQNGSDSSEEKAVENEAEKEKENEEEKRIAEQKAREEAEKAAAKEKERQDLIQSLGLVQATVTRVVDGDTFELSDGSKVRLIGVNTPESTTRTEPYGKEASEYTKSRLEGKQVWLQKDVSETDRYGRLLRIVWLDIPKNDMDENEIRTKMFNAELVIKGYAEPATYPPDVKYSEFFRKFAREAREKEVGLWAYGPEGTTKGDFDTASNNSSNSGSKSSSSSSGSKSSSSSSGSSKSSSSSGSSSSKSSGSSNNSSSSSSGSSSSESTTTEYFKNCTELRKVYPNGVPKGHPAYQSKMDRDKDGWACET